MTALVSSAFREDGVALIRIERPDARNALSPEVMEQLATALEAADRSGDVRAIVLAGDEQAFAAGSDIAAMRDRTFAETLTHPTAQFWPRIAAIGLPIVAAVSGYALGGGCELALSCDLIVASDTAVFSQAEITLGIIPGGGGTQRLARVIGKQRAMELVLTGRRVGAEEALAMGFVNRVVADGRWLDEALALATAIAAHPPVAVRLAKRAVLAAEETALTGGLSLERRLYELTMATEDRVEGMTAFLERRAPQWRGR
ncbi:MAG: Enoyl-CoA hydratase/isomerase [Solirubrobacterales bacterium]|nr:Enoyl-CoA hydratase/isomerase [Solirubrobacterales bacterium]